MNKKIPDGKISMKLDDPRIEEVKAWLKKSLYFLCTEFLGYKDWDLCHDDLESLLRRPSRKKAMLFPRNHLKTTFGTIGWAIQHIIQNPNVRILIGNGVWDMSRTFLSEIKAQLEMSQLKYLFGDFVSARWNADEIIVKQRTKPLKEPTIRTTGVEAEQTGGHYDVIILDDLTGLQNSQTPEQREKTKRFRRSMINLLEPGGVVLDIGTRWHLDDTFNEIFTKELKYYDVVIKQVIENGKLIFPKKFARKFDPERKDWTFVTDATCMDYIDHLKTSMPADEFSAQNLNRPFSSENQLFKPEMFRYWSQRIDGLYVTIGCDLASSSQSYADSTAIVVAGMDDKRNLYVLDYIHGKWGKPSEIVDNIFQMYEKWRPNTIGMEINGFQNMLKLGVESEMRRRRIYFPIDEFKNGPTKTKFERIRCLEPFYRNGNVYHALWMKNKDLEYELQTVSGFGIKGKHDDLMDALSMCLPRLHPGQGLMVQPEREGSWEWWLKMAQQNNRPYEGFFNYGR